MRRHHCIPVRGALRLLGSVALTVFMTFPVAAQGPRAKITTQRTLDIRFRRQPQPAPPPP